MVLGFFLNCAKSINKLSAFNLFPVQQRQGETKITAKRENVVKVGKCKSMPFI